MQEIKSITIAELNEMALKMYDPLVKAVVDVEKKRVVVDAAMHVDEELYLLDNGSEQQNLWGINLYPDSFGTDDFVEFDSMINIRPGQGNRSRSVEDADLQQQIIDIIKEVINA